MPLLEKLTPDEQVTFLATALAAKSLRKLVGRLGTAPPGSRLDRFNEWDLAWSLVDFYANDVEVAKDVDRAIARELGEPVLGKVVAEDGVATALTWLLVSSPDPLRDLAWSLLSAAVADETPVRGLIQAIMAELDSTESREAPGEETAETSPAPAEPAVDKELVRDAKRARTERDRARSRLQGLTERLADVEVNLARAHRDTKAAERARTEAEAERDRLAESEGVLRKRLQEGTAAEVARLGEELEAGRRRTSALEHELRAARETEAGLMSRVRALESERTRPPGSSEETEAALPAVDPAGFHVPVFTDEFYDSIRRWDRKVVKVAFDKVHRLAEDWRHPSLRAIPLEGLTNCYRIRIATDVRLIYRLADGGRIEILSLIDREDLSRYIRQAK